MYLQRQTNCIKDDLNTSDLHVPKVVPRQLLWSSPRFQEAKELPMYNIRPQRNVIGHLACIDSAQSPHAQDLAIETISGSLT